MFSCRFLILWLPFGGLPQLSMPIVFLQYLCMLFGVGYTLFHHSEYYISRDNKMLLFIFIVYVFYTFFYTYLNSQLPIDQMIGMPKNEQEMFQNSFTIMVCLIIVYMIKKYVDCTLFAKVSVIMITILFILYFIKVPPILYTMVRDLGKSAGDVFMEENGMISSLTLGGYASIGYVSNLWVKDKWSKKKWFNWLTYILITIFYIFIFFILGQRGPILFILTTTLFYYFAKGRSFNRYIKVLIFACFVIFFFYNSIIDALSIISPTTIERFANIAEDGGSGRFGDSNSVYSVALKQISDSPIFGSYFRILEFSQRGLYPHNIILELLMTFGIIFSFPLFILIWKAIKKTYHAIKEDEPIALFCLLYFQVLSCLMTSGTIFLNRIFWITLAIALTVEHKQQKKITYESISKRYNNNIRKTN